MIPCLIMRQGSILYRARIIENINEICDISDLSYTPSCYNKTYKRASTPNNTMFYGISGDSHTNMVCGCLGEVCDCFRVCSAPHKHYKIVIGVWETLKDFTLPQIINPDGNNKSDAFSNSSEYLYYLTALGNDAPKICDFQRLINYEFTKQVESEEGYWISAIFTEWILSKSQTYDGIIYESVQSIDAKLTNNHCVAIKPQVADEYLQFNEALLLEFDFTGLELRLPKLRSIKIPSVKQ